MDDTLLNQLNALVGAALRGIVEAGASAEAIGAFAQNYRKEASAILGITPAQPEAPDLQVLVTQAVKEALAEASAGNMGITRAQTKPPCQRFYVMAHGVRTAITLDCDVVEKAVEAKKGIKPARKLIRELAASSPKGIENRSAWVKERLLATIAFSHLPSSDETTLPRH